MFSASTWYDHRVLSPDRTAAVTALRAWPCPRVAGEAAKVSRLGDYPEFRMEKSRCSSALAISSGPPSKRSRKARSWRRSRSRSVTDRRSPPPSPAKAVQDLALAAGDPVTVLVKATEVMLGKE